MTIGYKYTNIPLDSVEYNEQQTLTEEQKERARQNIGAQSAIDSSHKLSSDLIDDTNQINKFVTSAEKASWNGKTAVSGTASGGNWTTLIIDGVTNAIPAGGGGGTQLYSHNITIICTATTNYRMTVNIINNSNTPFTISTLTAYLFANGFNGSTKMYPANGVAHNTNYANSFAVIFGIWSIDGTNFGTIGDGYTSAASTISTYEFHTGGDNYTNKTNLTFNDNVITL